ncbi:MAG: hypothetical protein RJB38_1113 [Pseudomonadota bacterium]|jgi:protein tyrosine/serine phosphatase
MPIKHWFHATGTRALVVPMGLLGLLFSLNSRVADAAILRFREVEEAKIFRGSQPETREDFEFLRSIGVRTILNLRTNQKLVARHREMAQELGLQTVNIPVGSFFEPKAKVIAQVQAALKDPSLQPIFVHCRHGKDRTGLMVGLYRTAEQGWTQKEAHEEMLDLGFNPWLIGLEKAFWKYSAPPRGRIELLLPDFAD